MASSKHFCLFISLCLLMNAMCVPVENRRKKNLSEDNIDIKDDEIAMNKFEMNLSTSTESSLTANKDNDDDDDDEPFDDDDFEMQSSPTTGGSNIFSLLRLASAFFPGSSGANPFIRNMLSEIFGYNPGFLFLRRKDIADNIIEVDYVKGLKPPPPPFQRQETEEEDSGSDSHEDSDEDDDSGGEESLENNGSREDSDSENASNSSDDYDDPPEGDGQGGGILGLLAGLSGGEDGQSDLGDLLATVGGIVANLSGDGIDLNALIASGLGLFVGLLSEGDENPGSVLASYLLTSLETITGGGAQNNGAFFGNLVSKLVKGTSAGVPEESSGDSNEATMSDSTGFILSLIMGVLGDMSKGSSAGSSQPSRKQDFEKLISEMTYRRY